MDRAIFIFLISYCLCFDRTEAQNLSLDSCQAIAKRNYPMVHQHALIEKSTEYSLHNAYKGYLPQINIAGQATYQSEVTQVPISLPNADIPVLSKDQYRLYGEISQPITDLFTVKYQREMVNSAAEVESQKIEVELYKLRERVNQLYFGILLMEEQIRQTELLKKDIQVGIDKANTAIANGIALKSSVDMLTVELLKANQKTVELKASRKGFMDMLSLFINQPVDEHTVLERPPHQVLSSSVTRPELTLFDLQKQTLDVQDKLITAKNLPRFSLFFQGGVGRPALNMLNNEFKGYYIGGLRLNWNLTGFYTYRKEKQLLTIGQRQLDVQRDAFLFNTQLTMRQQNAEIRKVEELLDADKEIVQLRENIKNTTRNQLENGTATSSDYITQLNAEDQAKQSQILHQIQLLMALYNYKTTIGS